MQPLHHFPRSSTHCLLRRTAARSSSVPYSVLTKFEMKERMKKLHDELRRILEQRNRLHDSQIDWRDWQKLQE